MLPAGLGYTQVMQPEIPTPRLDQGRHHRAKIGYVLLATEQTIEDDAMSLCPEGVGIHFTRAAIPDSITAATLASQALLLPDCARLLLPDGSLDVICYGCTSGSIVIGEHRVHELLRQGAPNAIPTSIIASVHEALGILGLKRIVVATPYLDEINRQEAQYMETAGFEILDITGLNIEKDSDMVRLTPDYIVEFALSLDRPDAEGIFISCGALRSLEVVEEIEQRAGKPVITSNQATIWHTLRLAGVNDSFQDHGSLLRDY